MAEPARLARVPAGDGKLRKLIVDSFSRELRRLGEADAGEALCSECTLQPFARPRLEQVKAELVLWREDRAYVPAAAGARGNAGARLELRKLLRRPPAWLIRLDEERRHPR